MPIHRQIQSVLLAALLGACGSNPKPVPVVPGQGETPGTELVSRGREAAGRGDAVRAEQYLSLAIEEGAERRSVLPELLRACLKSSHLRAALNYAEPYLLEHPEDDALRYLVATIHLGLGQVPPARRELGLLLQRNENSPDAHYLLGVIDAALDIEAARQHFIVAAKYTSDDEQRTEVQSRLAELRLRDSQTVQKGRQRTAIELSPSADGEDQ